MASSVVNYYYNFGFANYSSDTNSEELSLQLPRRKFENQDEREFQKFIKTNNGIKVLNMNIWKHSLSSSPKIVFEESQLLSDTDPLSPIDSRINYDFIKSSTSLSSSNNLTIKCRAAAKVLIQHKNEQTQCSVNLPIQRNEMEEHEPNDNDSDSDIYDKQISNTAQVFTWNTPATKDQPPSIIISDNYQAKGEYSFCNNTLLSSPLPSSPLSPSGSVNSEYPLLNGSKSQFFGNTDLSYEEHMAEYIKKYNIVGMKDEKLKKMIMDCLYQQPDGSVYYIPINIDQQEIEERLTYNCMPPLPEYFDPNNIELGYKCCYDEDNPHPYKNPLQMLVFVDECVKKKLEKLHKFSCINLSNGRIICIPCAVLNNIQLKDNDLLQDWDVLDKDSDDTDFCHTCNKYKKLLHFGLKSGLRKGRCSLCSRIVKFQKYFNEKEKRKKEKEKN